MIRLKTGFRCAVGAALFVAVAAQGAGVTLNSTRVGATDVTALEKFYESAFGMQEVQRIGANEVMLNFGDSVASAKANPAAQIVIMKRPAGETPDAIAHIIFNVTDAKATAA